MIEKFFQKAQHGQLVLVLLIFSYFLLMFGNGIVSLTHPDEVFYVQSAKEMIAHKSWLTPIIFDAPQFEKPIFFYWLLVIAIKSFDLSPFVARFWPAFFGILGVIVTYGIAWLLFRNKRTAFLSGLVLSSSFIYLALSRAVLTDMVFSIFVTITLWCFVWAYYTSNKNAGLFLFFVFMGISVLTKGILGVCFTLVPVAAFLIYKKQWRFLNVPGAWAGLAAFFLIALPWHWIMYQRYGQTFIDEYWHNVHLRRIFAAEHPRNDTWYFYLGLMFAGVMPWSFYLFPALRTVYRSFVERRKERESFTFLLFWILGVYIFVQPAHSKLASYIFPVYPAFAIILGSYLNGILEKKSVLAPKIIGLLWAAVMAGGSVAAIIFSRKYSSFVYDFSLVYLISGICLLFAAGFLVFTLMRQYTRLILINFSITFIILISLFLGRPSAEPWVSCVDISNKFKAIDQDESATVLSSKFYVRGIRYYTDRSMAVIDINGKGFFSPHPIPFLNTAEKLLDFLRQQPATYAILKEGDVERLHEIAGEDYIIEPIGDGIGGKYILKVRRKGK